MPIPPDRGKVASKGKPLSARMLNELQAQVSDQSRLDLQGGTFSGGNQFTPDQSKTFYAKITAVGSSGWHSWQKVIWHSATGAFIDPPSPAMKGNKDTNGAYALGGGSGTVGDIVQLTLFGARSYSSILYPVYSFTPLPGSSGLTTNYIGETCQGYYNGDTVVTGSGGYVTCIVPAGPSTSPWSVREYWRLRNGAETNTSFCPWQIEQYTPTSGWAFPNIPASAGINLNFIGKRGDLVSTGPNVYNCLQYTLPSFTIGGQMVCNGFGSTYFKIFGGSEQYFENWQTDPTHSGGGLFSQQVQWSALYDGASGLAWAKMYRSIAPLAGTFPALIGYDQSIGWHIRASTNATLSTRNTSFVVG